MRKRMLRKALAWIAVFSLLPASVMAEDILSSGDALSSAQAEVPEGLLPVIGASEEEAPGELSLSGAEELPVLSKEGAEEDAALPADTADGVSGDVLLLDEEPEAVTLSGKCGDGMNWELSGTTLNFWGTGNMYDYTYGTTPWFSQRNSIKYVQFTTTGIYGPGSVGSYAFANCENLESVTFCYTIKSIGQEAFWNCKSLEAIAISEISYLGMNAFYDCTALKSVYFSNNCTLKTIPYNCFRNCSSLSSLTLPPSITEIQGGAFYECESLKDFTLPPKVQTIGRNAFSYCTSMETVNFNSGLKHIEPWAFRNCSKLKSISLPEGLNQVDSSAFALCISLQSVSLPSTLTYIGSNMFNSCHSLGSITIPSTITEIEYMAFYNCSALKAVEIPASVNTIGVAAFYDCYQLRNVKFNGDAPKGRSLDGNSHYSAEMDCPMPHEVARTTTSIFNDNVTGSGFYPAAKAATWTKTVRDNYGGKITWESYGKMVAPMYRLFNPYSGEHFYTSNPDEKAGLVKLGWRDEGIGWYAPLGGSVTVYRLYNPKKGFEEHHYTSDMNEVNVLKSQGWNLDGPAWKSDDDKEVPLYRLFNPKAYNSASSHHYTKDLNERNVLLSQGWNAEGIGWYGAKA